MLIQWRKERNAEMKSHWIRCVWTLLWHISLVLFKEPSLVRISELKQLKDDHSFFFVLYLSSSYSVFLRACRFVSKVGNDQQIHSDDVSWKFEIEWPQWKGWSFLLNVSWKHLEDKPWIIGCPCWLTNYSLRVIQVSSGGAGSSKVDFWHEQEGSTLKWDFYQVSQKYQNI